MAMRKWSGDRSPTVVRVCWWSWSAIGASVGQEVIMFDGLVALAVEDLQMASPESV
jgi:hypothetical protein